MEIEAKTNAAFNISSPTLKSYYLKTTTVFMGFNNWFYLQNKYEYCRYIGNICEMLLLWNCCLKFTINMKIFTEGHFHVIFAIV